MDDMYMKGILYAAKLAEQDASQLVTDGPWQNADEAQALDDFANKLKKLVTDDIIESGVSEYHKYSPTSD